MSATSVPFTDAVRDVSGGNSKIPQSEYQSAGALPVVDQGKDFVAGFTDDANYAFQSEKLPVVVFGDHTRAVKYVDFPFAMGADGVKVLKPTEECDAKFLYHYLRQVRIPNAGYSRHYKFLKELRLPLPSLADQRRIAAILDKADALRAKRREAIAKLDQLLQSVFLDMFGDPERNPKGFPIVPLADAVSEARPITYGILKPGPDFDGGVPYIRVVDIQRGTVSSKTVRRTSPDIAKAYKRSTVRTGDVLMSIRGHVGRIGVVPSDLDGANITQDTARISVGSKFNPVYVRYALNSRAIQAHMQRFTRGAAVKGINLKDVREIPLPVPPAEKQERYARLVASIEALKIQSEIQAASIADMFVGVQHRAFAGTL